MSEEEYYRGVKISIALMALIALSFFGGCVSGQERLKWLVGTCVVANSGEVDHAYNVCFSTYAPIK